MDFQAKIAKYKTCEKKFNFGKLACMLETKYDQVEFAQETGLLGRHGKCVKCNLLTDEHLTFRSNFSNYVYFTCKCGSKVSVRSNTFMSKSRLSIRKMLSMAYWWTSWTATYDQIRKVVGSFVGFSNLKNCNNVVWVDSCPMYCRFYSTGK